MKKKALSKILQAILDGAFFLFQFRPVCVSLKVLVANFGVNS